MERSYNARCPAVKRLLKEAQELHEATEEYCAYPLEENLFEWHFTVRGPPDTEFDGGIFHGRIIMPAEYPMKPPNIIFFTPNGRFETNKKICLSISGHHPEMWQPSWSIRTALLAIIGFMPTPANGTIGSLDYTAEERAFLAKKSVDFECLECGRVADLLKERTGANEELQREAKAVSSQMVVSGKEMSQKEDYNESASKEESLQKETPGADQNSTNLNENEQLVQTTEEAACKPDSFSVKQLSPEPSKQGPDGEETRQESTASNVCLSASSRIHTSDLTSPSQSNSVSLCANNILLTAAVMLFIALVMRRLFLLLEADSGSEDMEEVLL